jgi:putative transcriptional regulator
MTSHHPPETFLLDVATGALPEALRLIVAGHLAYCGECRAQVGHWERLGGDLLLSLEPVPMRTGALEACLARLDDEAEIANQDAISLERQGPVPPVLRPFIGADLSGISWNGVGGYFDEVKLPSITPGYRVSMLRVPPGKYVPEHGHEGNEYMLVLAGGYTSGGRHYETGDFSFCDAYEHHAPIADDGNDCICLLVLDAPLAFSDAEGQEIAPFLSM